MVPGVSSSASSVTPVSTTTVLASLRAPLRAVIVAEPLATPVTVPSGATRATNALLVS